MLLRYSLGLEDEAKLVERALHQVIRDGARTKDIARGSEKVLTTKEMTAAVIARMS
jgi:3-isopropylmalate dehydrogenase